MRYKYTPRQQDKHKSVQWLMSSAFAQSIPQGFPLNGQQCADLEEKITGKLVFPWTKGYDNDRQEFDDLYPTYPIVIAYVVSITDIRECITAAKDLQLPLAIRSSGHSLAGYSVCTGIVVDLSEMKSIEVDVQNKHAIVHAGANFGDIYPAVEPYGLHMPTGDCPTVSPSGFMMGGGYGITSRKYGMGCDNVEEVTVMLASGQIVVANQNQNNDLFWAIRGGTGGNFGILLKTKFRLYDLGTIYGVQIRWPIEADPQTAAQVLNAIQQNYLQPGQYPGLGIETVMSSDDSGNKTLFFCATWIGTDAEFKQALQPLYSIGGYTQKTYSGKYSQVNTAVLDGTPDIPDDIMAFSRSAYIERNLSQDDWYNIAQYFFQNAPNQYSMIDMEAYGGRISEIAEDACAFIHRRVNMDFFVESFFDKETDDREKNLKWTESLFEFMKPYTNGQSYQNYPFRDQSDFRTAYWGKYYNQLVSIKKKYDPDNFFHYQQSIGPDPLEDSSQISIFKPIPIEYEKY